VSLRRFSRLPGFAPSELAVDAASWLCDEAARFFEFVGICLVSFFLPIFSTRTEYITDMRIDHQLFPRSLQLISLSIDGGVNAVTNLVGLQKLNQC
jgi:hypothetical protein